MTKQPKCPKCGSRIGVLVHYSTTRVFALKEGTVRGTWERGRVLRGAFQPEQSDSADENLVCMDETCTWLGGSIYDPESFPQSEPAETSEPPGGG